MGYFKQHPSSVAFLVLCWILVSQSKWNILSTARISDMSYLSYPHLRCVLSPVSVQSRDIRTSEVWSSLNATMQSEVLAMQYRTVIQLLNRYRQTDLSRVNTMKDIMLIVQEIFRNDTNNEGTTATTNREKTLSNPYSISTSSMNRLLENLWHSVELIDPSTCIVEKKEKKSLKSSKQSDRVLSRTSGIETLRQEYDNLKEAYGSAELGTASEVSFLKWAAGGVPAEYAFNTIVHNNSSSMSKTSRPNTATVGSGTTTILPPSPTKVTSTQPPSPLPMPQHTANSNYPTNEDSLLEKIVSDSVSTLGELEEFMMELMDSGGVAYEELCDISMSIDASLSSCGLTRQEIDLYCGQFLSEKGDCYCGENESVNLFEHLDSTMCDSLGASLDDNEDILYRHLQQQYVVPVVSSRPELNNLRQLHGHTMRRTANACAKYSPFEIVWRDDKTAKSSLK